MPPLPGLLNMFITNSQNSQSSAALPTTTAPTLPPRRVAQTFHVTITPTVEPEDARDLTLYLHQAVSISRASRSRDRHPQPALHNALFDCPVVSRQHAELELMDCGSESNIFIRDLGSTHGTKVNGIAIKEGQDKMLKCGDRIRLGERVIRGNDAHDGLELKIERAAAAPRNTTQTFGPSQVTGKFSVPNITDDEDDSDDIDALSVASEREHVSSAKTTPEQANAKLGSQQKPIDVDSTKKFKPSFVSLVDDDDDVREIPALRFTHSRSSAAAPLKKPLVEDSMKVVPDTYDDNTTIHHGVSQGPSQPAREYIPLVSPTDDHSGHSDESNYGSDGDDFEEDFNNDIDNVGSDDEDVNDYPSDEDNYPSDNDSLQSDPDDEDEAPEVHSSKKQPSPELGSPDDSARPADLNPFSASQSASYAPRPFVDYSHDSQRGAGAYSFNEWPAHNLGCGPPPIYQPSTHPYTNLTAAQPSPGAYWKPRSTCTYAPPPQSYGSSYPTFDADYYNSSRWDVPPAPAAPQNMRVTRGQDQEMYGNSSLYHDQNSVTGAEGPIQAVSSKSLFSFNNPSKLFDQPRFKAPVLHDRFFSTAPSQKPLPNVKDILSAQHTVSPPKDSQTSEASTASGTNKINISDIVEKAKVDSTPLKNTTPEPVVPKVTFRKAIEVDTLPSRATRICRAHDVVACEPCTKNLLPTPKDSEKVSGSKRKADEMVDEEESAPPAAALRVEEVVPRAATENDEVVIPRPAKRQRLNNTPTTVGKVAKYTGLVMGGAVVGGAGLMGFLCSPLAERAIEWLA